MTSIAIGTEEIQWCQLCGHAAQSAAESGQLDEELLPAALQQAGLPLMEVFLRRDEQTPYKMRHCSAVLVPTAAVGMDVGSGEVQAGAGVGTFRIQLGSNGQVTLRGLLCPVECLLVDLADDCTAMHYATWLVSAGIVTVCCV